MQFTITLEHLFWAGYLLVWASIAWLAIRSRNVANKMMERAHGLAETTTKQLADHDEKVRKADELREQNRMHWNTMPAHVRNQVRDQKLMIRAVQEWRDSLGDDLKCMMVIAETKDGTDIRLFHPEAFRNGIKPVKWSEGNDKELLLMMARAIGQVERAESGIIDVLQVMLDEQKDMSRNEAAKRTM